MAQKKSDWLRFAINHLGGTTKAAAKFGIHKSTVGRWLKLGGGRLSGLQLLMIEDASGLDIHLLAGGAPFPH